MATDLGFLVELLYGLSLREDCFYVKYGTVARDGMYLGRCFLETDQAVSLLCNELKGHPRLLVSLQDDEWFASFREARVPDDSFSVSDALPEHERETLAVVESAFGRADEAKAVAVLWAERAALISLVAQVPPERRELDWPIVGHILLSAATIDGPLQPRGLGLVSLAAAPAYRGRGVGTRLVEAALRRARLLGYGYVAVLGPHGFLSRFGFVLASSFGLSQQKPVTEPAPLVLELRPGALAQVSGAVRWPHSPCSLPPGARNLPGVESR